MNYLPSAFPVLCFCKTVLPGTTGVTEVVHTIEDVEFFLVVQKWELSAWPFEGMELSDANDRAWRVTRTYRMGPVGNLFSQAFRWLAGGQVNQLILNELAEETPPALSALKERVCTAIENDEDRWRPDELIAGESGPPRDKDELFDDLKGRVRAAPDVLGIIAVLDAPWDIYRT